MPLYTMISVPFFSILVQKYEPAAKSQLKKITKLWAREQHKNDAKTQREEEDAEKRNKNLEDAKKIKIEENKSLPPAERIKIFQTGKHRDSRVKVYGWVHRLRRQGMLLYPECSLNCCPFYLYLIYSLFSGKALMFITLRDGTGFLQCVLNDLLCQTYEAVVLSTESAIQVFGTLKAVPEGKNVNYMQIHSSPVSFCFLFQFKFVHFSSNCKTFFFFFCLLGSWWS